MLTTLEKPTADAGSDESRVRPRTVVLMCQAQFAPKVKSGAKRCTIRPPRKRPVKLGDRVSLREWTGKPYRSKQHILREGVVTRVVPVGMTYGHFVVDGRVLSVLEECDLALADGFHSPIEMLAWFMSTHGFPFIGDLIEWSNNLPVPQGEKQT